MTGLDFLSPDGCDPTWCSRRRSPDIDGAGVVTDVSALGKLEVRGDIDALEPVSGEHLVPIGAGRALLVMHGSPAAARFRLRASGYRVYDVTAALAAFEIEGEDLLRRLTELDLRALPAVGLDRPRHPSRDRAARGRALPPLRARRSSATSWPRSCSTWRKG